MVGIANLGLEAGVGAGVGAVATAGEEDNDDGGLENEKFAKTFPPDPAVVEGDAAALAFFHLLIFKRGEDTHTHTHTQDTRYKGLETMSPYR